MKIFNMKQGLILTYNQEGTEEIEGIKIPVIPTYQWLLEKE